MLQFGRWKIIGLVVICLCGMLLALPNVMSIPEDEVPDWVPTKTINLGLDLQGGSHLLWRIEDVAYFKEQMESLADGVRSLFRSGEGRRIGYQNLRVITTADGHAAVSLALRDIADREEALMRLATLGREYRVDISDTGVATVTFTEEEREERQIRLLEQSIEIMRRRVDEMGTREPTIARQGRDRILLQVPGVEDPEQLKGIIGQTAKMTFHLVDTTVSQMDVINRRAKPGTMILPSLEEGADGEPVQWHGVKKKVMLSGELLVDANGTYERGRSVVSFRFNTQGAKKFGEITTENVGRPFAVVLDGKVITAPVIREPILAGTGIISGSFTPEEANDLAILLRAGALPAPLTVIEERTVGPSLGQDSIEAGQAAALIGIVLVVIFMLVSYGLFGLFANIALFINMVLILGALSLLQATLTLPGIAGVVLTIGMAVDANVLIFERIREELRVGKTALAALENGFKRAFQAIIDSNLTTLIAAFLLFYFGSGTVKGFAVTLSIGIVTSMFTAIMLTRLFVALWVQAKRPKTIPI